MGRHMESIASTTSSTDALPVRIPGASGHTPAWDADRSPADRAAFAAASYVRIPTAAPAPATITAEQVREQLAAIR